MKKKIISLALVVAMVAIMLTSFTLAYFQDTDAAKNVMTTGNVKIYQNEQQRTLGDEVDNDAQHQSIREGKDGLEDFEDNMSLAPYTGSVGTDGVANEWGTNAKIGDNEYKMFDQNKNAIDKIVTVTNEGTEEAYIRTLFAFEVPVGNDDFLDDRTLCITAKSIDDDRRIIEVDGVRYYVGYSYYSNDSKLAAGATSEPSLRQIYLNATVGNEWYEAVGEEYTILVLSQATQTQGFTDAETALNTVFGDPATVEASKLVEWFSACN